MGPRDHVHIKRYCFTFNQLVHEILGWAWVRSLEKQEAKKQKEKEEEEEKNRSSAFGVFSGALNLQAFAVLEKSFARSHRLQDPARNVRVISLEMEEEGNSTSQTVSERCFKKISYIHPLVSG